MGDALKNRIKQTAGFSSPTVEAILNLMAAADHVRSKLDRICAAHQITHGQYNVLRILRGVHPEGHPRCEIAARMLEKAPDVTRLVDRLEAQGLVERDRSEKDRRLSITRIADNGLNVLAQLDTAILEIGRYFGARVSAHDCRELTRICEGIYAEDEP